MRLAVAAAEELALGADCAAALSLSSCVPQCNLAFLMTAR